MNRIYVSLFVVFVCGIGFVFSPATAAAEVTLSSREAQIAELKAQVAELQLKLLKNGVSSGISVSITPVWTGEDRNIAVSSLRLVRKDEGAPEGETLMIRVKSGKEGFSRITGEVASYEVYLYEVRGTRIIKISSEPVAEGKFLVPYARGTVEFRAKLDGSVFEGLDAGTELKAEVRIDSNRQIDETSERDNKKMSPVWVLE